MMKSKLALLAAVAALSALPSAASAATAIAASGARAGNFTFSTPTALVPLTSAGGTALTFNLTAQKKLLITFSAECSVDAPAGNNFAWVDIDVLVDGVAQAPTVGVSDAFCSADGVAGFGGYTRASITLLTGNIPVGNHTVQILARRNSGATGGWLSDTATVVQK